MPTVNSFGTRTTLQVGGRSVQIYSLAALEAAIPEIARLPYSMKILLENALRHEDGRFVKAPDIEALARWDVKGTEQKEISFAPARVLLQDFTGVPAVVDLAAMRDGIARLGGDPNRANPRQRVELVIDHSVQVDYFGRPDAFQLNAELEFSRNKERYAFLRWGQNAFHNFRVVPPDTGIVHQVNLEYLARVVVSDEDTTGTVAYPDTLVGTDSHTTMVSMCPEYGATIAIFPIDEMTLDYLRLTNRDAARIKLVEVYAKAQGLFRTAATPDPIYSETIDLDLATVEPSVAGPKRPQDRVSLKQAKSSFQAALSTMTTAAKKADSAVRAGVSVMANEGGVAGAPHRAPHAAHGEGGCWGGPR